MAFAQQQHMAQALDDAVRKAQVVHQRADRQAVQQPAADGREQVLAELGVKGSDALVHGLQLRRPFGLGHVRDAEHAHVPQRLQHVQAQLQVAAAGRGIVGPLQVVVHVALQAVGVLDGFHQLEGRNLAVVPVVLLRAIHGYDHAAHEFQQIGVHPLDVGLVEQVGIDGLLLQAQAQLGVLALQQRLQALHRRVQRVGHHLQPQAAHVLQLLGHRAAGTLDRLQRGRLQVAGARGLRHLLGVRGNQHLGLLQVRQPALQGPRQLALQGPEHQHPHDVEQGVEHGQLDQRVVAQAHGRGRLLHPPGHGRQQQKGDHRRGAVEHHVRHGQPLAGARAADHAHDGRGHGRADVGANRDRQGLG